MSAIVDFDRYQQMQYVSLTIEPQNIINGETWSWQARSNETGEIVASMIVWQGDRWGWNCWNGFESDSIEETARKIASATDGRVEKIGRSRPKISARLRYGFLKAANFCCQNCGASESEQPLEIDHVIPFSKGGANHRSNYQVLCKPCNLSKGSKTFEEWLGSA